MIKKKNKKKVDFVQQEKEEGWLCPAKRRKRLTLIEKKKKKKVDFVQQEKEEG